MPEWGKAIEIPTEYDHNSGQDVVDGEVRDDNIYQWLGSSYTPSSNEQEMNDNDEDTNLRRSARDIKPPSTYKPSFGEKKYVDQLFGV